MTEYAFVLGKNWLLSVAELIVYLLDRGILNRVVDNSRNAIIIESNSELSDEELIDIQAGLGGCFKVGKVVTRYDASIALRAFPRRGRIVKSERKVLQECPWISKVWRKPRNKKIKFGVSTYPIMNDKPRIDLKKFTFGMNEWIKRRLLEQGASRTVYYAYEGPDRRGEKRPNTALWPATIARHNLVTPPNAEILAVFTENSLYFAKTIVVYDSQLQQFRDEARPYKSSSISTSPKLCRTLLNLAGARSGDTVLDPFCGTGTLLMEAALLDMKCIGIDIDRNAVQGAISNLKWLGSEIGQWIDFRIIHGDSRQVCELVAEEVDAIAFEPDLGPVYSEKPKKKDAKESLTNLTELYQTMLKSASVCLKQDGRVGMTIPVVHTLDGIVYVNFDKILKGTEFVIQKLLPSSVFEGMVNTDERLMIKPERRTLPERKHGQIVQRDVLMLERN